MGKATIARGLRLTPELDEVLQASVPHGQQNNYITEALRRQLAEEGHLKLSSAESQPGKRPRARRRK